MPVRERSTVGVRPGRGPERRRRPPGRDPRGRAPDGRPAPRPTGKHPSQPARGPARTSRAAYVSHRDPARFRPELEGLRGVACALVIAYHLWSDRVSGGVDAFFVITGFLLVPQFVRAAERGSIDVLTSWRRTLRRLVPPTAVVLLASLVAGMVLLPASRWAQTAREIGASAVLLQNWRLAADAADYYAARNTASVVQHLWSLSVQAQVALALPALVVGIAVTARSLRMEVRSGAIATMSLVALLSFVYSVRLTADDQRLAYFHTVTRLWEFAVGGLLGLLIVRIHLPRRTRLVMGWVGLVALLGCGLLVDVSGSFPGWVALCPVLAVCLVLTAERTGHRRGVDRWLVCPALQHLGQVSFPLYLWHWPVLLFVLLATGREDAGLATGLLVIVLSLVLAVLTDQLLDRRLARIRTGRWAGDRPVIVAVTTVLALSAVWLGSAWLTSVPAGQVGGTDRPGAVALTPGYVDRSNPDAPAVPTAAAAYDDWVDYDDRCHRPRQDSELTRCRWIAPAEADAPVIVVIGDSHMQQFLPALEPAARANGWAVDTLIRGACPFSTASEVVPGSPGCTDWNRAAIGEVMATRPAAVVAAASRDVRAGLTELTPPGFLEAWRMLEHAAVPVLAVRDNPRFDHAPAACVEARGRHSSFCDSNRAAFYSVNPPITGLVLPGNVHYLDTADLICRPATCAPEVGNVTVYLDDNHLTASYAASMAPMVGPHLEALVAR